MLLEIGIITKPHGLRGEVIVKFMSDRVERRAPGSIFQSDIGELRVAQILPHQDRFIVLFDGYRDRNQADLLRGLVLRAEPLSDPEELWVHELVGTRVIDDTGVDRGTVVAVVANPASPLLELDGGHLVPTAFVTGPPLDGVLSIAAPPGLFDL